MNPKILITLGPSSLSKEIVEQLSGDDVSLFRINLSHTPIEKVEETIINIQQWTDIPISLDTEGAQIRNQKMEGGQAEYKKGSIIKIYHDEVMGNSERISFTPSNISKKFKVGDEIRVDFDSVCFQVIENCTDHSKAEVRIGGLVFNDKAADLNRDIDLESITQKDKNAIKIGRELGIKHYALSFCKDKKSVELFRELTGDNSIIISKIESINGLVNLPGILESTDQILIDRGDLSRQVPIQKIPFLQRRIISMARSQNVIVNVATNLLESMVKSRSPTRAEVNDVISTLLMGANGLVLAAETAIGEYPIEVIEMVRKLIDEYHRWTPNTNIVEILKN